LHIKIQERRASIILGECAKIDKEIRIVSSLIVRNIGVRSSFIMSEAGSKDIERKIKLEVEKVMSIPAASVIGITMRIDLLQRLNRINMYAEYIPIPETRNDFHEMNTNNHRRSS